MVIQSVVFSALLYTVVFSTSVIAAQDSQSLLIQQIYDNYMKHKNCEMLADEVNSIQLNERIILNTSDRTLMFSSLYDLYRCYQKTSPDCAYFEDLKSASRKLCMLLAFYRLEYLRSQENTALRLANLRFLLDIIEYLYALRYGDDAREIFEAIPPILDDNSLLSTAILLDRDNQMPRPINANTLGVIKLYLLDCLFQESLSLDERLLKFAEILRPYIDEPLITKVLNPFIMNSPVFQSSVSNNRDEARYRLLATIEPFFRSKVAELDNTHYFYRILIWSAQALKHYDDMLKWSLIAADRVDDSFRSYEADALHYMSKKPDTPRPHEDTITIMEEIGLIE